MGSTVGTVMNIKRPHCIVPIDYEECAIPGCKDFQWRRSAYCVRHTCDYQGCIQPSLSIFGVCDHHQCKYQRSTCNEIRMIGSIFCAKHLLLCNIDEKKEYKSRKYHDELFIKLHCGSCGSRKEIDCRFCVDCQVKKDMIELLEQELTINKEHSKSRSVEHEDLECSICLEPMELKSKNDHLYKLKCHHMFHTACIKKWNLMHTQCPVCRTPFII